MQKFSQYSVIALMLFGLLAFYFATQAIWLGLAQDLQTGDWACRLVRDIDPAQTSPLIGIEGRLLWSASSILLLLGIVLLLVTGANSLLQRLPRGRLPVAGLLALTLFALLVLILITATPDHRQFMGLSGGECAFTARQGFGFIRYLLLIFQAYYAAPTLDAVSYAETALPGLLLLANLTLLLGLLATAWPQDPAQVSPGELAARIARYRLLLLSASALFTAIALYHMSTFNWFAQVLAASDSTGAAQLRGLQRGITLYLGLINSLALVLFFLPTGWLLSRQAAALSARESAVESPQAREAWLTQQRLTLSSGPLLQIGTLVAPLLVSGGLTLLQQALAGP